MALPFLTGALLAGSTIFLAPLASGTHEDERIGFALRSPKGWTPIPIKTEERWIVARYLSDKPDFWTDADSGWTFEHTPQLRVIAFLEHVLQTPDAPEAEEGEEAEERTEAAQRPEELYRDYLEYMRETFPDGFYVAEEEEDEVNGIPARKLDLRVETATGTGNRRLVTWIFELEVGDVAVEFDVLEETYDKRRSKLLRTLRSFESIERTMPLHVAGTRRTFYSLKRLMELTPEERASWRKAYQEETWNRMVETATEGWNTEEFDGVRVLTRSDSRHAREVAERVLAIRAWLDEAFPELGPGEYARLPLVRICKDVDEERAYWQGSGVLMPTTELITHKDTRGGSTSYEWEYVNRQTWLIWLADRAPELFFLMPAWLSRGMGQVIESADAKRSRIKFRADTWEPTGMNQARSAGLVTAQDLMLMPGEQFRAPARERDLRFDAQATALARFLVSGPGSRGRYKGLLARYMENLRQVQVKILIEIASEEDEEAPTTEEEEDELFRRNQELIKLQEKRVLDQAFERTFGSWSPAQYRSFEKAYLKEVD